MKTFAKLLIVPILICSMLICCDVTSLGGGFPTTYNLENISGHTISIVHNPACRQFSDSLVLIDRAKFYFGDSYGEYGNCGKISFFALDTFFESRMIYYDGRYAMKIADLPRSRHFWYKDSYTPLSDDKYENDVVFRFTKEDYEYAVKHGTDLGEKK